MGHKELLIAPNKSGAEMWNFLIMRDDEIHMESVRCSEQQTLAILKQAEAGTRVPKLCREHGMSSGTFYNWRSKSGGGDVSMMARVRELEAENRR